MLMSDYSHSGKLFKTTFNLQDMIHLLLSLSNPYISLPQIPHQDYYREVNAANYLSKVRVPLVVVNARDDPFIDGGALPSEEKVGDAPVRLIYHDYGGHCGFMTGSSPKLAPSVFNRRKSSSPQSEGDDQEWDDPLKSTSKEKRGERWLPIELTRFIEHLEGSLHAKR
ncbi:unnamed protein product [Choristocarpus tenellus]